jgi:hypothetical protein
MIQTVETNVALSAPYLVRVASNIPCREPIDIQGTHPAMKSFGAMPSERYPPQSLSTKSFHASKSCSDAPEIASL